MYNNVNITVRKDFHNNQYTAGNKITKNNNVCNSDNSKNVENRHQSQKSAIKKYREVFILEDRMVKFIQGWEITNKLENRK